MNNTTSSDSLINQNMKYIVKENQRAKANCSKYLKKYHKLKKIYRKERERENENKCHIQEIELAKIMAYNKAKEEFLEEKTDLLAKIKFLEMKLSDKEDDFLKEEKEIQIFGSSIFSNKKCLEGPSTVEENQSVVYGAFGDDTYPNSITISNIDEENDL